MPIRKTDSILQSVSAICYVPFDSETIGNPALDVGDVLTFSGGGRRTARPLPVSPLIHLK
jgi:hypothetical protein